MEHQHHHQGSSYDGGIDSDFGGSSNAGDDVDDNDEFANIINIHRHR